MKQTISIDVASVRTNGYEGAPPLVLSVGDHQISIELTNVPADQTSLIDHWKSQCETWTKNYQTQRDSHNETANKLREANGHIRDLDNKLAALEDSPRPALSDAAVAAFIRELRTDVADSVRQIIFVRLLTGWGAERAKAFVTAIPQAE